MSSQLQPNGYPAHIMPTNESLNIRVKEVFDAIVAQEVFLSKMVLSLLRYEMSMHGADSTLRSLVQQHPLGFLCLKWNLNGNQTVRVHIWDRKFEWTQNPNWPIHDHVFGFKSTVLFGQIQNKTYEIIPHGDRRSWNICEVQYSSECSSLIVRTHDVGLKILSTELQPAGSTYELPAGKLHRSTLRSGKAVTVLATTACSQPSNPPRVIGSSSFRNLTFSRIPTCFENIREVLQHSTQLLENNTINS